MTAVVVMAPSAQSHAPAAASARSVGGSEAFSAALAALDGRAQSAKEERKRSDVERSDPAAVRPSTDLRAALIGGALASLPTTVAEGGVDGERTLAAGDAALPSASSATAARARPQTTEADASLAPTPLLSGAKVTAERTFLAPTGVAKSIAGAAANPGLSARAASAAEASAGAAPVAAPTAGAPFDPGGAAVAASAAIAGREPSLTGGAGMSAVGSATLASSRDAQPAPEVDAHAASEPADEAMAAPGRTIAEPTLSSSQRLPIAGGEPESGQAAPVPTAAADQSSSDARAPGRPAVNRGAGGRQAASSVVARPSTRASAAESAAQTSSAASDAVNRSASTTDPPQAPDDPATDLQTCGQIQDGTALAVAGVALDAAAAAGTPAEVAFAASGSSTPTIAAPTLTAPVASASGAAKVREIEIDLAPSGVEDTSLTLRLSGDKLGVLLRAASPQAAATLEGARDAIADRLAAIGLPVSSFIIQQTGASDATGNRQSASEGDHATEQRDGQASDRRGGRRDASGF